MMKPVRSGKPYVETTGNLWMDEIGAPIQLPACTLKFTGTKIITVHVHTLMFITEMTLICNQIYVSEQLQPSTLPALCLLFWNKNALIQEMKLCMCLSFAWVRKIQQSWKDAVVCGEGQLDGRWYILNVICWNKVHEHTERFIAWKCLMQQNRDLM